MTDIHHARLVCLMDDINIQLRLTRKDAPGFKPLIEKKMVVALALAGYTVKHRI